MHDISTSKKSGVERPRDPSVPAPVGVSQSGLCRFHVRSPTDDREPTFRPLESAPLTVQNNARYIHGVMSSGAQIRLPPPNQNLRTLSVGFTFTTAKLGEPGRDSHPSGPPSNRRPLTQRSF